MKKYRVLVKDIDWGVDRSVRNDLPLSTTLLLNWDKMFYPSYELGLRLDVCNLFEDTYGLCPNGFHIDSIQEVPDYWQSDKKDYRPVQGNRPVFSISIQGKTHELVEGISCDKCSLRAYCDAYTSFEELCQSLTNFPTEHKGPFMAFKEKEDRQ